MHVPLLLIGTPRTAPRVTPMARSPRRPHRTYAMHFAHYGAPLRKIGTPLPVTWIPVLDAVAAQRGIARTDLVREIIEGWLCERGLLVQRGAVGSVVPPDPPVPADLSAVTAALREQWERLDATERARLVYRLQRLCHQMGAAEEGAT
jgi:hypothetical protein